MTNVNVGRTRWFALFVLTAINLLNYIDRYIFSALLPAIKKDLGFTDTQLGMLGSGFILAYLFISPVFGYLGDCRGRARVMSFGVAIWSAATAFSGLTSTYTGQMLTRIAVGVGESAYSVIAPSSIADYFSKGSRGRVFAIYSGAIPIGSALGYVLGGILEPLVGWRHSFFVVGVPGLLMAALLFFMKDPVRTEPVEVQKAGHLRASYRELFMNGGFLLTVLGYAAYTFVVGGMAFWMPTYIVRYFDVSLEKGNLVFGGVTVAGGFVGTLLGGWLSDRIERRTGNGFLKVSVWSMVFAAPLFYFALTLRTFESFAVALFVAEVAIFLCISPLDAAVISYVRPGLRATAMALNVFLIHFLGDGISRAMMGAVSDHSDLRTAIMILPVVLVFAGILWQAGLVFFWQSVAWPEGALVLPTYQAHRGFRPDASVVENTLPAFRRARAAGAEMYECDVHLSQDGEAVVFHDEDLQRAVGRPEKTADLTAEELARYANVPRLVDLLKDPDVPRFANIELKTAAVISGGALEVAVARAVREAGAESRVLFSSFNPYALRRLSRLLPNVPRALLATEQEHVRNKVYLRRLWGAWLARPHIVNLDEKMLTAERLRRYRDRGVEIVAWTVNDPARAKELLGWGAKGIISDTIFR